MLTGAKHALIVNAALLVAVIIALLFIPKVSAHEEEKVTEPMTLESVAKEELYEESLEEKQIASVNRLEAEDSVEQQTVESVIDTETEIQEVWTNTNTWVEPVQTWTPEPEPYIAPQEQYDEIGGGIYIGTYESIQF